MSDWRSLGWYSGSLLDSELLKNQGIADDDGYLPLEGAHIAPVSLYFRNTQTSGIGTKYDAISTAGTSGDTSVTTTTASGTEIQATKTAGGSVVEFISGRTPVGGATFTHAVIYFWAKQSADTVNAGLRFRLYKRSTAGVETELTGSPFDKTVELTTANTRYEITCDFTDVALLEDERIVIKPYIVNVGTMGAGTATLGFNGAVGGTTGQITAYPDPANGNPRFAFGTSTSWAACRSNATSDPVEYPSNEVVFQGELVGATYVISRIGYVFDTSSIPDNATITSATFSVYSTTTGDGSETTNPANGALVEYTPSSDTAPTTSDYQQFGTTRLADADVTRASFVASSAYKDWVLNATGLAAINKTGNTRLGIRPSNDFSDATAPTARSYALGYYAAQAGTDNDPKLVVNYTTISFADSYINVYPAVTFKAEGEGATVVDLTAASLGFTKQNPQLKATTPLGTRSFTFTGQAMQLRLTAAFTAAALTFSAKAMQSRISNNLTAAALSFSAKAIDAFNSGVAVIVDLTTATFSFVAKSVQNKVTVPLTQAALTFSAKAMQLRLTAALTLASLLTSAKTLQLRATVALSAAQNRLTSQAIGARLALTMTAANTLRFIANTLQSRMTVVLTKANLYFLTQVVDVVGEGVAAIVVRFRYSLTRFRQILKSRKY